MKLNKNQKWGLTVGIILAFVVSWGIVLIGLSDPGLIDYMGLSIFVLLLVGTFIANVFFWYLIVSRLIKFEKAMGKWMNKMEEE